MMLSKRLKLRRAYIRITHYSSRTKKDDEQELTKRLTQLVHGGDIFNVKIKKINVQNMRQKKGN